MKPEKRKRQFEEWERNRKELPKEFKEWREEIHERCKKSGCKFFDLELGCKAPLEQILRSGYGIYEGIGKVEPICESACELFAAYSTLSVYYQVYEEIERIARKYL